MEPLLVPEMIMLDAYKKSLKYIRKNYKSNLSDLSKSYLGEILGTTNAIQRYNFLEQAKSVFITDETDPRHLDVNIFFNAARAPIPTIHITNPAEVPIHDSLSITEGYFDPIFDDANSTYTKVFSRRFKAKYNILITSDNTNEVVLLYQVMRSMTISLIEHLNQSGLENIKISGSEINLKPDIVPINVFIKSIGLEFEYEVPALQLSTTDFLNPDEFIGEGEFIIKP
jgi:hypothetical protein